jgi:hypothetical protein
VPKLVNGITADFASVQMIMAFKLLIQLQLLVEELQQTAKTA